MKRSYLVMLVSLCLLACENQKASSKSGPSSSKITNKSTTNEGENEGAQEQSPKPPREKLNGGQPQRGLAVIPLFVENIPIEVELAITPRARQIGLMHRYSMPKDKGMFFAYPEKSIRNFWMRDTLIPLSIAYIRDDGTITDIIEMVPAGDVENPPTYPSSEEVRFALEMNKGWFDKNNIKVGMKVVGIEQADKDQ